MLRRALRELIVRGEAVAAAQVRGPCVGAGGGGREGKGALQWIRGCSVH